MEKWIKTSDKLPLNYQTVWCFTGPDIFWAAILINGNWECPECGERVSTPELWKLTPKPEVVNA